MVSVFKKNNVEVVTLTSAEYDAWLKVAQDSSYKQFAKRSARRQEADRRSARSQVIPIANGRREFPPAACCARRWDNPMDRFIRGITRVSQACGFFAAALIAAGVVVVCEMVIIRYVLNENTIWQTDFVTYSLVAATFIGSPYLLLTRGHVNVDVLPLYLGPKGRYRLGARRGAYVVCILRRDGCADLQFLA